MPHSDVSKRIQITYTNYKELTGIRIITPIKVWFGSTAWYPEEQWLLTGFDHDKEALRDYALLRIQNFSNLDVI